jgi:hypothetical protein
MATICKMAVIADKSNQQYHPTNPLPKLNKPKFAKSFCLPFISS